MIDYTKTSDGLYAYRYPRASVTADAVLFAEKEVDHDKILADAMRVLNID